MPKLVVIDPGHGGSDPGAVASGMREATLTLSIAKHLRAALVRDFDVDVAMTRDDNRTVSLNDRAALANARGADLFVSVHINSGGGTGYEDFIHDSAAAATVQRRNRVHASVMEFLAGREVRDRGKKRDNFAVLRLTRMPAVLTENLFIDTARDAGLLRDGAFRKGVGEAHARGIARALNLPRLAT